MLKLVLAAVLVLQTASVAIAQSKPPKPKSGADKNAEYFDDGGFSNASNIVKLNVGSIVVGSPTISLEHYFGSRFALEAGIGIIMPYSKGDGLMWAAKAFGLDKTSDFEINNPISGLAWEGQMKFWSDRSKGIEAYSGLAVRNRHFNFANDAFINHLDVYGTYGRRWGFLPTHIVLDAGIGFGARITTDGTTTTSRSVGLVVPITVTVGYLF